MDKYFPSSPTPTGIIMPSSNVNLKRCLCINLWGSLTVSCPLMSTNSKSHLWYHKPKTFLVSYGFINSHSNAPLFVLSQGSTIISLLVYVNDIIVSQSHATSSPILTRLSMLLPLSFLLKILGTLIYQLWISSSCLFFYDSTCLFCADWVGDTDNSILPRLHLYFCLLPQC